MFSLVSNEYGNAFMRDRMSQAVSCLLVYVCQVSSMLAWALVGCVFMTGVLLTG